MATDPTFSSYLAFLNIHVKEDVLKEDSSIVIRVHDVYKVRPSIVEACFDFWLEINCGRVYNTNTSYIAERFIDLD